MKSKVSSYDIYYQLSKKEQILFLFYDNPNSTKQEIESCYSVTSVTIVTNEKNNSNNNNNNHIVTEIKINNEEIKRLCDEDYLIKNKSNIPFTYNLSEKGMLFVEAKIKPEIERLSRINDKTREKEKKLSNQAKIREFLNIIDSSIIENKDKPYLYVDFKELVAFSIDLAEFLIDEPSEFIHLIENIIKSKYDEPKKIYFKNLLGDSQRNITNLRGKDLNRLVSVVGEVRSRSKAELELKSVVFECPSCGSCAEIQQQGIKIKEPSKCSCGRKGKFKVAKENYQDVLKITLWDLYEDLDINQVPEEINVIFEKDHFNFNTVEEGQKIRINGILESIRRDESKTETLKVIKCLGIERLDQNYTNTTITDEDKEKFLEINKDPFKFYENTVFSDVKNNKEAKILMTLANYGKINCLFLGDPGTGKSMICKRVIKYSLKGTHLDAMKTSKSGLSGAATKNEFTGKYTLDSGAIRKIHPDGVCVIDEIQFNKEIQKDLYSIISDKRIRVAKANINADFPCDINVIATANPIREQFHKSQPISNIFDIEKALIDRFGFLVFFNNTIPTAKDVYEMAKIQKKGQRDWSYTEQERDNLEILRKHQIQARSINVELKDEDYKKIGIWVSQFWFKISGKKASHRATQQLISLLEAWCRIHHREETVLEDYQEIGDLFIGLEKLKNDFFNEDFVNIFTEMM